MWLDAPDIKERDKRRLSLPVCQLERGRDSVRGLGRGGREGERGRTLENTTDEYRPARTGCILGIFADISKIFFFFFRVRFKSVHSIAIEMCALVPFCAS